MSADVLAGLYRGVCVNTSDPLGLLRIKALVPQVLGDQSTGWAWGCFPPGWPVVFEDHDEGGHSQGSGSGTHTHPPHEATRPVPQVGETVWIMFEAGDIQHPVWMGTWRTS